MRERKVIGICAAINKAVAGATINNLKLTHPSSLKVRQAHSLPAARTSINKPQRKVSVSHAASVKKNWVPKNCFIIGLPIARPPKSTAAKLRDSGLVCSLVNRTSRGLSALEPTHHVTATAISAADLLVATGDGEAIKRICWNVKQPP